MIREREKETETKSQRGKETGDKETERQTE